MKNESNANLREKLRDTALITAAIQRGIRDAVLDHARAGRSVCGSENGTIVWVTPEEILARFGPVPAPAAEPKPSVEPAA